MKFSDMMQYADLKEEIKDLTDRIKELKECAASYPKGTRVPEDLALEIIKCQDLLRKRSCECASALFKIEKVIGECEDSYIRRILRLRFCDRLSWNSVAKKLGGTTGDSCRMLAKRYIASVDK